MTKRDTHLATPHGATLRLRRLGIDTHQEAVITCGRIVTSAALRGVSAQARIEARLGERSLIATLGRITTDLLADGEAGLSEAAWHRLAAREGDEIAVTHAPLVDSLRTSAARSMGVATNQIIRDIVAGRYSDVDLAAFVAACGGKALDQGEILGLTRAVVVAGSRLDWGKRAIQAFGRRAAGKSNNSDRRGDCRGLRPHDPEDLVARDYLSSRNRRFDGNPGAG